MSEIKSCPSCGSTNSIKSSRTVKVISGVVVIGLGIWLLIFPLLGIILIIAGAALLIFGAFFPEKNKCKDCKNTWKDSDRGLSDSEKREQDQRSNV